MLDEYEVIAKTYIGVQTLCKKPLFYIRDYGCRTIFRTPIFWIPLFTEFFNNKKPGFWSRFLGWFAD